MTCCTDVFMHHCIAASSRVDDRRAMPVRGAERSPFGTAEPTLKVGGPLGGVGWDLDRTRVLGVPVWPFSCLAPQQASRGTRVELLFRSKVSCECPCIVANGVGDVIWEIL